MCVVVALRNGAAAATHQSPSAPGSNTYPLLSDLLCPSFSCHISITSTEEVDCACESVSIVFNTVCSVLCMCNVV